MDAATLRTGNLNIVDVAGYRVLGSVLTAETVTVAVAGDNCDWAAYDAPRRSLHRTAALIEQVVRGGRKLRREEALAAFPLLNPERWRK